MNPLVNIAIFQVGWFACVISMSAQLQWVAVMAVFVSIAIHLLLSPSSAHDFRLVIFAGIIGLVVDSLLISQHIFVPSHSGTPNFAPPWLVGLWMLFGITLNHSMKWFNNHLLLAALAGLIFAPLAYWAGERFEVLQIAPGAETQFVSLLIIGACWFVLTPMLLLASRRLKTVNLPA